MTRRLAEPLADRGFLAADAGAMLARLRLDLRSLC
jgi:hypothetical protein